MNNELTEAETNVAKLLAMGYEVPQIAKKLSIRPRTITTHVYNINQKLYTRNQIEIARYALKTGLIDVREINFGIEGEPESKFIQALPDGVWRRLYETSMRVIHEPV